MAIIALFLVSITSIMRWSKNFSILRAVSHLPDSLGTHWITGLIPKTTLTKAAFSFLIFVSMVGIRILEQPTNGKFLVFLILYLILYHLTLFCSQVVVSAIASSTFCLMILTNSFGVCLLIIRNSPL